MNTVCQKNFQQPILEIPDEPIIEHPPLLLFGDFLNSAIPKENRIYQEIPDIEKLMVVLKVQVNINIKIMPVITILFVGIHLLKYI